MHVLLNAPKLTPVQARLLLNEAYDETYGIAIHDETSSPSSLFCMKPAQDTYYCNGLYERLEKFAERRIGEHFKISFTEFINQPTYLCEMMLDVASILNSKENAVANNINNMLNNNGSNLK